MKTNFPPVLGKLLTQLFILSARTVPMMPIKNINLITLTFIIAILKKYNRLGHMQICKILSFDKTSFWYVTTTGLYLPYLRGVPEPLPCVFFIQTICKDRNQIKLKDTTKLVLIIKKKQHSTCLSLILTALRSWDSPIFKMLRFTDFQALDPN